MEIFLNIIAVNCIENTEDFLYHLITIRFSSKYLSLKLFKDSLVVWVASSRNKADNFSSCKLLPN